MKVLIQQMATEQFLKSPGVWVKDRSQARVFAHSLQAVDYCAKSKLKEVRLVMAFPDPRSDIFVKF